MKIKKNREDDDVPSDPNRGFFPVFFGFISSFGIDGLKRAQDYIQRGC